MAGSIKFNVKNENPSEEIVPTTSGTPGTTNEPPISEVLSFLKTITAGQNAVFDKLDNIENTVHRIETNVEDLHGRITRLEHNTEGNCADIAKVQRTNGELRKMTTEIAYRSKCIKDMVLNSAAHTLNMSRKIHGASSVLDPVKQFKEEGGYKDWSIKPDTIVMARGLPTQAYGQVPGMPPMANMNPFALPFTPQPQPMYPMTGTNVPYGGPTQVYGNRIPVYHRNEERERAAPDRCRTPLRGNRTPRHDASEDSFTERKPIKRSFTPANVPAYPSLRTPVYQADDSSENDFNARPKGNRTPNYKVNDSSEYESNRRPDFKVGRSFIDRNPQMSRFEPFAHRKIGAKENQDHRPHVMRDMKPTVTRFEPYRKTDRKENFKPSDASTSKANSDAFYSVGSPVYEPQSSEYEPQSPVFD